MSSKLIPRTYDIDVARIMRRRRGQYDLEDEFLWFSQYLSRDRRWRRQTYGKVGVSDDSRRTVISLDCDGIELMNEKQNFAHICRFEEWMPESITLTLPLQQVQRRAIHSLQGARLLFLKKAGPGIGGGFDVTPIVPGEGSSNLVDLVEQAINEQNKNPKYRRDQFILQVGVENPLLTRLNQKIDLRLYMLIVGDSSGRMLFYACRVGDIRNTAAYPYDPSSTDRRLQITNVSQNRGAAVQSSDITRIFSRTTMPEYYDSIFEKLLIIAKRIGVLYSPLLVPRAGLAPRECVTLIGLDAVVDSETLNPMIVELNRRPTVYSPEEARDMQYSSTLFMKDVFDLGIQALADGLQEEEAEGGEFVLVHVREHLPA